MALDSPTDVAMILPIPTPPRSHEDAVRFINLEKYSHFFKEMEAGFPKPEFKSRGGTLLMPPGATKSIAVQQVGSFEASFVPSERDFYRLDARFRISANTWANLPIYNDYGFAVFKLKAGAHTIHPMAFEFRRRDPNRLFFPTVHIHDSLVHATATFDHTLYCQKSTGEKTNLTAWEETPQIAGQFMQVDKSSGIVSPQDHCYKLTVLGRRKNADIYA